MKYMPISQLMGIFVANTLFCFNICNWLAYIIRFLLGNSLIVTIFLLLASYLFGFCKWHRIIIYSNLINISIELIDKIFHIPISNLEILVLYSTISILFIFVALYYKFKCKNHETSIENISQRIERCCR